MIKWIAIAASVVLLITGSAYAKDYEVKKKAGDYDVTVKIDRNPPVVGDNNIVVEIKDAKGGYVTDAKVVVEYTMPAMPGMPAMNYKAKTSLDGNEYKGKMNLSMSGSWSIEVKITKADKTSKMKFSVDAQ
ncbi:MAG: FixH family protein [Nitrospirae bacterium]|nr:FixH family protein [Nitrospirota bacterium]